MKILWMLFGWLLLQMACVHAADSIYVISLKDIDGQPTSLKVYKGKVLLIVECRFKMRIYPPIRRA